MDEALDLIFQIIRQNVLDALVFLAKAKCECTKIDSNKFLATKDSTRMYVYSFFRAVSLWVTFSLVVSFR